MVPVKYHVQKELMPDKPTRLQLENAARESDVFSHIAVMPDVHSKFGRKCPTGTVMATKSMIFPQVMDTAPNCGMRLLATPWGEDDLRDELIDEMFLELIKAVPTHTYFGNYIDFKTTIDICRRGSAAVLEYLGKSKEELQMIYKGGNFFDEPPGKKEIFDSVPKIFIRAAQFRLGILGEAGNHFLDLMKIEKVLDEEKARILGLKKGQYVFLMHTGSGILGQYISYFFTPKREEHLSMKIITKLGRLTFDSDLLSGAGIKKLRNQVKKYREKTEFFKIDPQSKTGRAYWTAHRAGANYGFANRTMITQNVKGALKKIFNKKVRLKTVCDLPHIFVEREKHYGREVWVHRNGASRGFGPRRMKKHLIFSKTGEPGVFAGSMSTPSYLVCGRDENESTFFSLNHGAGKSKKAADEAPKTKTALKRQMKESRVKLYNAKSKGVVYQASGYYKDIEKVVEAAKEYKMAVPVVKMRPVAVLMA